MSISFNENKNSTNVETYFPESWSSLESLQKSQQNCRVGCALILPVYDTDLIFEEGIAGD